MTPRLSYLVLRCADIEVSKRFYEALGVSFVREQHGEGPAHYAADLGGVVLELYPSKGERAVSLRLGLCVDGGENDKAARIIEDPDGNVVELSRV